MLVTRKPNRIEVWQVPVWGTKASEDLPAWLVQGIQDKSIYINRSGGLGVNYVWGSRGCAPGDYIILTETGEIDFCKASDFNLMFTPVAD